MITDGLKKRVDHLADDGDTLYHVILPEGSPNKDGWRWKSGKPVTEEDKAKHDADLAEGKVITYSLPPETEEQKRKRIEQNNRS